MSAISFDGYVRVRALAREIEAFDLMSMLSDHKESLRMDLKRKFPELDFPAVDAIAKDLRDEWQHNGGPKTGLLAHEYVAVRLLENNGR